MARAGPWSHDPSRQWIFLVQSIGRLKLVGVQESQKNRVFMFFLLGGGGGFTYFFIFSSIYIYIYVYTWRRCENSRSYFFSWWWPKRTRQDSKFEWLEATVEKALECARGGEWGYGMPSIGKLGFRRQHLPTNVFRWGFDYESLRQSSYSDKLYAPVSRRKRKSQWVNDFFDGSCWFF